MSRINFTPSFGKSKKERLTKYTVDRDYIFAPDDKIKALYPFQQHHKWSPPNTVLIEFKNLPKLPKKLKDATRIFFLLQYKVLQCSYVSEKNKLLVCGTSVPGDANFDLLDEYSMVTPTFKRRRQDQKVAEMLQRLELSQMGNITYDKSKTRKMKKDRDKKRKKLQKIGRRLTGRIKDYNLRARMFKTETLLELQDYIINNNYQPKFDESSFKLFTDMFALNLFMAFPNVSAQIPEIRSKTSNARSVVDLVDVPISSWDHRSIIHNLLDLFVRCCIAGTSVNAGEEKNKVNVGSFPKDTLKFRELFERHITLKFLRHYVSLLESPDDIEREHVQRTLTLMHHIGSDGIIKKLNKVITEQILSFCNDYGQHNPLHSGTKVRSLLLVLAEVLPYYDSIFLVRIILPLYCIPIHCLVRYNEMLYKCVTLFISREHSVCVPATKWFLRHWPKLSAFKQLLYLDQVHAVFLQLVQRYEEPPSNANGDSLSQALPMNQWYYHEEDIIHLGKNIVPLFQRICNCISGPHFDVSQAAVKIVDHPAVFFPYILFPVPPADSPNTDHTQLDPNSEERLQLELHINPLLIYAYKAFRRTVGTHAYIEVRKTLDTLMGLMETKWPAICRRAAEEEDDRILKEQLKQEHEQQEKELLKQEQKLKLREEQRIVEQQKLEDKKKPIHTKNISTSLIAPRPSGKNPIDFCMVQQNRRRTWSRWEAPTQEDLERANSGNAPLTYDQIEKQKKRKNSLEIFAKEVEKSDRAKRMSLAIKKGAQFFQKNTQFKDDASTSDEDDDQQGNLTPAMSPTHSASNTQTDDMALEKKNQLEMEDDANNTTSPNVDDNDGEPEVDDGSQDIITAVTTDFEIQTRGHSDSLFSTFEPVGRSRGHLSVAGNRMTLMANYGVQELTILEEIEEVPEEEPKSSPPHHHHHHHHHHVNSP